jgi:hypothetical protein
MKLKSVANYFMIIAICILLVGCGGSSDEKNTGSADQLRKEYETAMSSLNLSGASFSRSKSNSNTIVLSFDDLNKRVQDASTTEEKIKLMTAAVSAMNEFSSKADALLGNDTIGSSERSEVSTKRNMVVKRSSEARKLLATFAVRLNKEKE